MTDSNKPESNSAVPAWAVLDTWSDDSWTNGIQINELEPLDTLTVETSNHTYELTVINPRTGEVLVRGGKLFPERRMAWVSGASLGGSILKLHGIYVGFALELLADGQRITTTPVRKVEVAKERMAA